MSRPIWDQLRDFERGLQSANPEQTLRAKAMLIEAAEVTRELVEAIESISSSWTQVPPRFGKVRLAKALARARGQHG